MSPLGEVGWERRAVSGLAFYRGALPEGGKEPCSVGKRSAFLSVPGMSMNKTENEEGN
jgi:hypothetical protein